MQADSMYLLIPSTNAMAVDQMDLSRASILILDHIKQGLLNCWLWQIYSSKVVLVYNPTQNQEHITWYGRQCLSAKCWLVGKWTRIGNHQNTTYSKKHRWQLQWTQQHIKHSVSLQLLYSAVKNYLTTSWFLVFLHTCFKSYSKL